jgi:single-strand DNA-binding protein
VIFNVKIERLTDKGAQCSVATSTAPFWLAREHPSIQWSEPPDVGAHVSVTLPPWMIRLHKQLVSVSNQRTFALYSPGEGSGLDPAKADNPLPGSGLIETTTEGRTRMNSIEIACVGRVGRDAELKTSQAGKPWLRVSVGVGSDENTQWLGVTVFGDMAVSLAPQMKKGSKVYVEGHSLKIDTYTTQAGEQRHGLKAIASKVELLGQIGHARSSVDPQQPTNGYAEAKGRPVGGGRPAVDDEIPFTPSL